MAVTGFLNADCLTLLDAFFTTHTDLYASPLTTLPAADGTGAVELGPARVHVTSANFAAAAMSGSNPQKVSSTDIAFADYGGGSAASVIGAGLYSALTSGTLLAVAECTPFTVNPGVPVQFASGQLRFILGPTDA